MTPSADELRLPRRNHPQPTQRGTSVPGCRLLVCYPHRAEILVSGDGRLTRLEDRLTQREEGPGIQGEGIFAGQDSCRHVQEPDTGWRRDQLPLLHELGLRDQRNCRERWTNTR